MADWAGIGIGVSVAVLVALVMGNLLRKGFPRALQDPTGADRAGLAGATALSTPTPHDLRKRR